MTNKEARELIRQLEMAHRGDDYGEAMSMAINLFNTVCKAEKEPIGERNEQKGITIPPSEKLSETGDFPTKYVIELGKPFRDDDGVELRRAKGFRSLVFDSNGMERLKPYTEPSEIRGAAYDKGYSDGCDDFREMLRKLLKDPIDKVLRDPVEPTARLDITETDEYKQGYRKGYTAGYKDFETIRLNAEIMKGEGE